MESIFSIDPDFSFPCLKCSSKFNTLRELRKHFYFTKLDNTPKSNKAMEVMEVIKECLTNTSHVNHEAKLKEINFQVLRTIKDKQVHRIETNTWQKKVTYLLFF